MNIPNLRSEILAASLVAMLVSPAAFAQDADPFVVDSAPKAEVPVPSTDTGGFRTADTPAPVRTPEEEEARGEEINANYDATLDVYRSILERRDTDPKMVERRIDTNREIIDRYGPKLSESEQRLRQSQVGFMNRILELKRQRDSGALDEDAFRAEVVAEKGRYERSRARIADDVSFYGDETKDAQARLTELEKEHGTIVREREMRMKDQPELKHPADAVVDDVFGTLSDLSGFRIRFTMDAVEGYRRYDHEHSFTQDEDIEEAVAEEAVADSAGE